MRKAFRALVGRSNTAKDRTPRALPLRLRRAARPCRTLAFMGPVRQAEDKSRRMTHESGGRVESVPRKTAGEELTGQR